MTNEHISNEAIIAAAVKKTGAELAHIATRLRPNWRVYFPNIDDDLEMTVNRDEAIAAQRKIDEWYAVTDDIKSIARVAYDSGVNDGHFARECLDRALEAVMQHLKEQNDAGA